MNTFPIKQLNLEVWKKKVDSTSMFTIQAEDDALPVLKELDEILSRLVSQPIEQTIDESNIEFFFSNVFPPVCQKIIRSRYFKSTQVLRVSNWILKKCIFLTSIHFEIGIKFPKFLEVLTIVFSDESYFKTNNQMSYTIYPYSYFPQRTCQIEINVGDMVDILKVGSFYEKFTWSQGQVIGIEGEELEIVYLYDGTDKKIKVKKDSNQLAPFGSQSLTFQWRKGLKKGDLVDVEDNSGSWYNATVVEIIERGNGKKNVKVSLKVYHQNGNKSDENGQYFGFSDYEETIDFTSPKLAPYCSIAKQFCYESTKSSIYDSIEDINDYEFQQLNGEKIYALPRKKHLSQFQFETINGFGKLGGFDKYIQFLERQVNFDVFCYFVKGISGVAPYLNRKIVKQSTEKLKVLLEKYLFENSEKSKNFTKLQSQMAFSGLKALQRRVSSSDNISKYENQLKMRLVDSCLQSQAIKNKLQGLNELKDIVRSVIYASQKNKYIKKWVQESKIFEKVYITNSHVQLIKKSEEFFKYLISENILEVTDLERLYKLAQKGDFESRVSLYKLFQQVSHIFKKEHVQFLIDTILESDLNLILNQDIDLLHQLSRFSNYFPMEKVIKFFQSIILGDSRVKELNDYAIKKYSEIVAKNHEVKPFRRNIIKAFLEKLATHDTSQITKVLKGIFDGIGTGEWGKKDLNEIIAEEKVDEVVVATLQELKNKNDFHRNYLIILEFLIFVYRLSSKIKIDIKVLSNIWNIIKGDIEKQKEFYRWANQIMKCEQSFDCQNNEQLQVFYRQLFPIQEIPNIDGPQMQVAKNFFVQINKKAKYISVSNTFKDRELEKQYKRRVEMKSLKLIELLTEMVYRVKEESVNNQILNFYIELYTSKDNSQQQINQFIFKLLKDFKEQFEVKNTSMLVHTIKLMEVVINDSEKNVETNIKSLLSKKQPDYAKFIVINETSYLTSESAKKLDVIFAMNTPVIKMRKYFAKSFNLSWQQIKIVSNKQIEDYENSLTLSQIKLNPNQPLTISRRSTNSQSEEQLMLNDEMNPKLIRCFKVIFERYSTNGKMDKNEANSFTTICLGSSCSTKYYNEKIANLYNNFDDDHDGFLTFQNFLKFYGEACRDRPSTVWTNLRSFGVLSNFRFSDEPQQKLQVTKYPRNIIAQQQKVYEILFDLLHSKDVASVAFELLERLPVSKIIQQQLLNIECREDLFEILNTPDLYELFYKLNIIEYLAHSTELETEKQKGWHIKFVQFYGYESLYTTLVLVMNKIEAENSCEIRQQIFETSLNLLNEYWIECFSQNTDKLRLSLSFISYDEEIDNKMDYLVLNRFGNSDKKIQPRVSKIPAIKGKSGWKGEDQENIIDFLLKEFTARWILTPTISNSAKTNQRIYGLTRLLCGLIDSLDILFLNKNPQKLIDKISIILDQAPSSDLIKQFYCLILSQCFHADENKNQGFFIRQLFKNLTKGSITSEHFRVLSILVFQYGIGNANDNEKSSQTTKRLKQVLFDNVFNHTNELTVQGCAKLLTKFELQDTPFEIVEKIWDHRLFNPSTICQKQQSKVALYDLILKICNNNPEIVNKTIHKVLKTLDKQIKTMKIVYCNEFKQRSSTGFAGLKNLGSTCYINSMIQQLFMNRTFRYSILRANDGVEPSMISVIGNKDEVREVDDNFLHQVQRIFSYLELTNRIDFVPRDFCVAYKPFGESVNVLIQQDVQQFVSMFFDRLEAGLSKTVFKKLVQDFYSGKTANLFKCHACQKTKKVEQNFHSISLQVKTSKTLAESFNRFCLEQMINDYRCDFCEKKVDVTKVTRISKAPKTLIIHLQRIVFNYDTFVNQKITTKHSFPPNFNIYESTLENYERAETGKSQVMELPKQFEYNLIGIICHAGTADSGHYISYIKTNDNKWIEFNDSSVTAFNPSNIESECFGGNYGSSSFDDDFFQEKRQSSKSAYLLLYEKSGEKNIELVMDDILKGCKNEKQVKKLKEETLKYLDLKQVLLKINKKFEQQSQLKVSESQNTESATPNIIEEHEQSSQAPDDSQKQTRQLLDQKEIQIRRHLSEDNIDTDVKVEQKGEQVLDVCKENVEKITVLIEDPISPYLPEELAKQIQVDNQIHFFEKCLSSSSFVKFFSQLISKPNDLHEQILCLCQKLTFGFWLKSPSFKDLLNMLDGILKVFPLGFESVVTNNLAIENLLIESSDSDIRTAMANFLAKVIADTVESKKINIKDNPDDPIFNFLDKLLSLLPTTVSKCWTKFGQYFQFWYELSKKGERIMQYMIDREIIKHFMDYFLDNKSPLKIYATKRKHPIGSSYANPNFSMLLKSVFSLLQQRFSLLEKGDGKEKSFSINSDEELLLMSFDSLQKLISDNYESIAAQLVKQICPGNISATEKAAVVLLRGINKSNADTIQPYLQVLHQFVLIGDEYQDLRIKWVIGRQTLVLSSQSKSLTALNGFSLDERIHNFNSSLDIQNGSSLLEPIFFYYKRMQTFSLLMTRGLLRLCQCSQKIRKYIFSLSSPTLTSSRYVDFLKGFIEKYYEEQKRSYSLYTSSSQSLNKQELGKEVKELYERIVKVIEVEQQQENVQQSEKQQQGFNQIQSQKCQIKDEEKNDEEIKQTEDASVRQADGDESKKKDQQVHSQTDEQQQDDGDVIVNPIMKRNSSQQANAEHFEYLQQNFSDLVFFPMRVSDQLHGFDENQDNKNNGEYKNSGHKVKHHIYSQDQEEEENLIKSKNNNNEEFNQKNKIKQVWHPIKFQYTPIRTIQVSENFTGLSIEEHRSPVTYILTAPTGTSNQTFVFSSGVQRISDRIMPQALKNSKIEHVHGFFAHNTSKDYLRIQTNDGSVYCKSGDRLFIWADSIEKIWVSERSIDWPKWQLFPNKAPLE